MPRLPTTLRAALLAAVVWSITCLPARASDPEFVAMDDGRFAMTEAADRGVVIRFAQDQFQSNDRASCIYGVGSPFLRYDSTSRTLLLCLAYEGSVWLIAFTPKGEELYRLDPSRESDDLPQIVPGTGTFALTSNSGLTLFDCRTGAVVKEFPIAGPGQRLVSAFPLDRSQFLAVCSDDQAGDLVLFDAQEGRELWRQPADGLYRAATGDVAWDEQILCTAAGAWPGPAALTSRSRTDGSVLARASLADDSVDIVGVPGSSVMAVFSAMSGECGGLTLRDRASLAVLDTIAMPAGWPTLDIRQVWNLATGRVLLDGYGHPCPGAHEARGMDRWQVEIAADGPTPWAQVLTGPVAVDPQGRGWRLGTRRREVVGDVPWLTAGLPDPSMPTLPEGAFGDLAIVPNPGSQGQRRYHGGSLFRGNAPPDTAAFTEFLDGSDVCFLGTIETIERLCLGSGDRPEEGVALAGFRVEETFWGPPVDGPVYIDQINVPGCVESIPPRRPADAELAPGSRHVVVARLYDGVAVVRGAGLFPWRDGELEPCRLEQGQLVDHPLGRIRERSVCGDLRDQFRRADLVVEATVVRNTGEATTVAVEKFHKGAVADRCLDVVQIQERGHSRSW
jgi:hypothetical protein